MSCPLCGARHIFARDNCRVCGSPMNYTSAEKILEQVKRSPKRKRRPTPERVEAAPVTPQVVEPRRVNPVAQADARAVEAEAGLIRAVGCLWLGGIVSFCAVLGLSFAYGGPIGGGLVLGLGAVVVAVWFGRGLGRRDAEAEAQRRRIEELERRLGDRR